MPKRAKKLPCETSAALVAFKDAVRNRAVNERIDEIEKRRDGEIHGLQARCKLLEEANKELARRLLLLESGARTPGDRKKAMYNLVASGRGDQ